MATRGTRRRAGGDPAACCRPDGGPRGVAAVRRGRASARRAWSPRRSPPGTAGGVAVEWVRATEAARDIPLGSFAHVLGPGDERPPPRRPAPPGAVRGCGDRAGAAAASCSPSTTPTCSTTCRSPCCTWPSPSRRVRVLISVRTGEPLPAGPRGAVEGRAADPRIDVGPAAAATATEQLVVTVLGDGVPASLLDRIWQLSRGNVLFVRELVTTAARAPGHAAAARPHRPAGRRRAGPAARPGRGAAAAARARAAGRARGRGGRRAGAAGRGRAPARRRRTSRRSRRRGLVEVVDAGGDRGAAGGPPAATARCWRPGCPACAAGRCSATWSARSSDLDRFDRLRMATWRLESGEPGDPDQLLALAREALGRLDHRAGRAAGRRGRRHRPGRRRPGAGRGAGRPGADRRRPRPCSTACARADPEDVARVAIDRASNLFLQLDRSRRGLRRARGRSRGPRRPPALAGRVPVGAGPDVDVLVPARRGGRRSADGCSPTPTPPRRPGCGRRRWRSRCGARRAGSTRRWPCSTTSWTPPPARHRRDVPYGEVQLRDGPVPGPVLGGRGPRSWTRSPPTTWACGSSTRRRRCGASSPGSGAGRCWCRGRAREALAELQRSSPGAGRGRLVRAAAAGRGHAGPGRGVRRRPGHGRRGDRRRRRRLRRRPAARRPHPAVHRAVAGLDAGRRRARRPRPPSAAWRWPRRWSTRPGRWRSRLLHAAVRLGRAAEARRAARPAGRGRSTGRSPPMAARHARRAGRRRRRRPGRGGRASSRRLGADLLAAEACRAAANAATGGRARGVRAPTRRAPGRRPARRRAAARRSPALAPARAVGEELTEREREVAALAARGRTSPEIAEALYLSVRTVDTHLSPRVPQADDRRAATSWRRRWAAAPPAA